MPLITIPKTFAYMYMYSTAWEKSGLERVAAGAIMHARATCGRWALASLLVLACVQHCAGQVATFTGSFFNPPSGFINDDQIRKAGNLEIKIDLVGFPTNPLLMIHRTQRTQCLRAALPAHEGALCFHVTLPLGGASLVFAPGGPCGPKSQKNPPLSAP
jgi:hypothetical protein